MVIAEGDHDDHIAVLIEGSAEVVEPSLVPADVRAAVTGNWVSAWIRLTAERLLSYADEGKAISAGRCRSWSGSRAQKSVGGPAGIGSGSGSTSGTRARTSSWNRRASSSASTLSGVWMKTVGERPSRSHSATGSSQCCHPAIVRAMSSRPM